MNDIKKESESGESTTLVKFDNNPNICTFKHTPLPWSEVKVHI